jgi:hypothetical protein
VHPKVSYSKAIAQDYLNLLNAAPQHLADLHGLRR